MEVTTMIYSSFQRSNSNSDKCWTARFPVLDGTVPVLVNYTMVTVGS